MLTVGGGWYLKAFVRIAPHCKYYIMQSDEHLQHSCDQPQLPKTFKLKSNEDTKFVFNFIFIDHTILSCYKLVCFSVQNIMLLVL